MTHDPYSALRIPVFRNFMVAISLLRIGTAAQGLAIGWEVYNRTDQALALGLVGLVQAIPMFLFTLPAGYLADVFDRRKLIMVSMAGATVTSLALAVFSYYQWSVNWLYLILFMDSTILRLGWPAQSSILPLLVPDTDFESAVKWRTSLMQVTGIVGPAVGGFIIAFNIQAAYLLSALSSGVFILFLFTMRLPDAPRIQPGNMLPQVIEGLRFVWHQKLLLGAISLDLFAVLLGGAVYLLPIFARDIINLEATGLSPEQALGWLRSAPAIGACIMALLLAYLPPLEKSGKILLVTVAGFGFATIVFGFSKNFWLSMFVLALTGAFDNVSVIIRHVITQMSTPNEMRGRVSAVSAIFIGSSNEVGGFESGLVAQLFTPVISVISGGIGTLLVVMGWSRIFPDLKNLGSLSTLSTQSLKKQNNQSTAEQMASKN